MYALPKKKLSSGQAVLIVLLGMAVTLTVVLSIVSRSITDISLSTTDEESARAFSAAEAGIENMILTPGAGTTDPVTIGDSTYVALSTGYGEGSTEFNFSGEKFTSGQSATVWLVSHDADNNLTCSGGDCYEGSSIDICWGNDGATPDVNAPAIEVTFYYDTTAGWESGNYSNVLVSRSAFDPYFSRATNDNHFTTIGTGGCTIGSTTYPFYSGSVALPSGGGRTLFARIKFLYNDTTAHALGIKNQGTNTFPSQGRIISSTGTSGSSTRKVEVVDLYKSPLGIFEAGLFSVGDLKKD